ncbi:MAG: M36 family metallopeptidase, partial [Deltaproteobacteria bacterium]|nr:M36 family metallopeptidase [Deltaproteobacteria bacterium]
GVDATAVAADGTPRFLRATSIMPAPAGATAEDAARFHLAAIAPALEVSPNALATLRLRRVHTLHGGAKVAVFRPQVDGLEVFRGDVAVLMRADSSLVAVNGAPRKDAVASARVRSRDFAIGAADALATAMAKHSGLPITAGDLIAQGVDAHGDLRFALRAGVGYETSHTMRARKVLLADGARLVPSWWVEGWAPRPGGGHVGVFNSAVDARSGLVRVHEDRSAADAVSFRVWQSGADKRPTDGPIADFNPHPTGAPDGSTPAFVPPTLTSIAPFNHNPAGGADPWLPPGATQTQGNNIDAYTDDGPDGFSSGDLRAAATGANTFDYTYDVAAGPQVSANQKMAAVVQAFYTTNFLHDYWYDSGFDEASGNGQQDNFGRGGVDGDPMQVQAQDAASQGQRNNANMDAASDGQSPTMQMYLWSGADDVKLTLSQGGSVATGGADFGPQSFDLSGTVVLANDGSGTATDACQPITNNVSGKIVLIDRGTCTFASKAATAANAGAIGVLIANNQPNAGPMGMPNGNPPTNVAIPTMAMSQEAGTALKTALEGGAVTATLHRVGSVERDGDLDNSVVAHEWGHYLHLRLAACGAQQCAAMSEGWGDFVALHQTLREGDNLDGSFAAAQYAAAGLGDAYFGIRRAPYSHDLTKNPFTFKHISDGEALPTTAPINGGGQNSEVHNAGEIWAEMLFEAYTALQRDAKGTSRSFDDVRRAMADYVVGGLEMVPADATYTEQRDAILAVAAAANPADAGSMALAFARRGAGSCAVSPPRDSGDFAGVVEDFTVSSSVALSDVVIDDGTACDHDGVLDAGETGRMTVTVRNGGAAPLSGATVTVSTTTAGVTVPTAPIAVPDLAPFASTTIGFDVTLGDTVPSKGTLDLTIASNSTGACATAGTLTVKRGINLDIAANSSTIDDVETETTTWAPTGDGADGIWARAVDDAGGHAWHGVDFASQSETSLVSPDLVVGTDPFVISFKERHDFETGQGSNWDGAVIELSADGGATWTDIGASVYGGPIDGQSGNVLGGQNGLVGQNPAYPAYDTVMLDQGTTYAGKTVKLRFRIGTDQAAGASGIDLDDLSFTGITNKPFASTVAQAGCSPSGGPDAGPGDPGGTPDGGCCDAGGGSRGATAGLLAGLVGLVMGRRRRRK